MGVRPPRRPESLPGRWDGGRWCYWPARRVGCGRLALLHDGLSWSGVRVGERDRDRCPGQTKATDRGADARFRDSVPCTLVTCGLRPSFPGTEDRQVDNTAMKEVLSASLPSRPPCPVGGPGSSPLSPCWPVFTCGSSPMGGWEPVRTHSPRLGQRGPWGWAGPLQPSAPGAGAPEASSGPGSFCGAIPRAGRC